MNRYEDELKAKGIAPTVIRSLVYGMVSKYKVAFSINELEDMLVTVDRSSIFRALSVFVEHGLLHVIDDGNGHRKYCFCGDGESKTCHECRHIHFTCRKCGHTYCLEMNEPPALNLPSRFKVEQMQFLAMGVCPDCNEK